MNPQAYRRLTAWLGMIAIALIVLMPVVSQLAKAGQQQQPVAMLCSAMTPSAHAGHAAAHTLDDTLDACGYCGLLADHAVLPAMPPSPLVLIMFVITAALPILSTRFTPLGAFPSGRPRAPPVFRS